MSTGGKAAAALALGVGGGLLYWQLTKKDTPKKPGGGGAPATATPPAAPAAALPRKDGTVPPSAATVPNASTAASASPTVTAPSYAWPCRLKLDGAGLTVDGERGDVAAAVKRCKAAGRAELVLGGTAPAALNEQLAYALFTAGVPLQTRAA